MHSRYELSQRYRESMSFAPFEPLRGSSQHRASSVPTYPEVKAVPDDADVVQVHGVAGKHEVKKPVSRPVLHRRVLVRMVATLSHSATAITVRRYMLTRGWFSLKFRNKPVDIQ